MALFYYYFKLFNTLKDDFEVQLAELELRAMFGRVERISNFVDVLIQSPVECVTSKDGPSIQDFVIHELPYGPTQGFMGTSEDMLRIVSLVKRLAYFREIMVVTEDQNPEVIAEEFERLGTPGVNVETAIVHNFVLGRFITNQYFLEKSWYVTRFSRSEEEVDRNIDSLVHFLMGQGLSRMPASETLAVGKRLEDYFAIREEPSLYLTHYLYPYKGKFHPKMARALINYVHPQDDGIVMDNFAGSGTLLVEATLMGLDSVGVELNPVSVLMSQTKCDSLNYDPVLLKSTVDKFLMEINLNFEKFA